MASRLLSDTILVLRARPAAPVMSGMSRVVARRVIAIVTVVHLLLFIYLTEVTQVTTTAFDIEQMEMVYHQWQERNQELEREISELESPQHVLRYAEAHGMTPRTEAEYLIIHAGQ
jgi:cell division protein FtsL